MTGADIITLGDKHIGEPYVLGTLVPKDNADYTGPWDCAEFVSWLYYQTFGILYGCANNSGNPHSADAFSGYWGRDADLMGHIITIEEAKSTPGAIILRLAGNGEMGHIVISDGNGGTVAAHGTADGVINSVVDGRRWDMGILVPGVTYHANPMLPLRRPSIIIYRLTIPNMVSPSVGKIQTALTRHGFDTGGIDNRFGEETRSAIKLFQNSVGLNPDGEAGALTIAALDVQL